jgi:hypothetical protein
MSGTSQVQDFAAVVAMLGGPAEDPAVDFLVDPGAACRALDALPEHGGLLVRAAPPSPSPAGGASHGPAPVDPVWIRVMRGAREVGLASPGGGMVRRADHVELEEREDRCCDAATCDRRRAHAAAWLVLDPVTEAGAPGRLLIAEHRALVTDPAGPAGPPGAAPAVASRLAAALGVPLRRDGADLALPAGAAPAPPAPLGELLPPGELARFALRTEGDRVVLRDWDSPGPRASAPRNTWIGVALLAAAAACWFQLRRSLGTGGVSGAAIAAGVAAALLSLAAVAFLGVARYSARYCASSAPLWTVARDRLVVLPWVSREGAVDARPEGRLGAAIALGEVRAARPQPRGHGFAVELDTDHGLIDAMLCPSAASAELWCAVLDAAVDEARHPRQGATARQRAKQRVTATA